MVEDAVLEYRNFSDGSILYDIACLLSAEKVVHSVENSGLTVGLHLDILVCEYDSVSFAAEFIVLYVKHFE